MDAVGIAVSVLRGVHVAALASLFGALLFTAAILPAGEDAAKMRDTLRHLALASALMGLIAGGAWLMVETAAIAGTDTIAATLHAVPIVALRTQFGHWLLARLALMVAVLAAHRTRIAIPTAAAGVAIAMQPALGHAGAMGGGAGLELMASESLHLLACGAWLGGLLPLFLAVGRLPHQAASAACHNFTPIGLAAVLLLGGTAVVQVGALMGGLPGLFGTQYGHVALVKLALFVVLLVLAAANRLLLTDRLTTATGARRLMRCSIAAEMALGTAVIVTAGFLASLTPGTHEQPVWPFPWRLSLAAFGEPFLRAELVPAVSAAVIGVAVFATGAVWRRIRWPALGIAVVIEALAIPHLDLLFVAAYPTSYFTSPTEFAATAIVSGARLYAANCAACHGAEAQGNGPAARSSPVAPADLTADHFRAHSDGELYWFVGHGFATEDGKTTMPGFAGVVSSDAVWYLIDYLHALNAGAALRRTGNWPQPLPMPQFDAECADGRIVDLDDLRGRALRIIAVSDEERPEPPLPPDVDAATILVARHAGTRPTGDACVANERQLWTALAILLGVAPNELPGTQILVDRNALLREAWRPGDPGNWADPGIVAARLRDLAAHPLAISAAGGHAHQH